VPQKYNGMTIDVTKENLEELVKLDAKNYNKELATIIPTKSVKDFEEKIKSPDGHHKKVEVLTPKGNAEQALETAKIISKGRSMEYYLTLNDEDSIEQIRDTLKGMLKGNVEATLNFLEAVKKDLNSQVQLKEVNPLKSENANDVNLIKDALIKNLLENLTADNLKACNEIYCAFELNEDKREKFGAITLELFMDNNKDNNAGMVNKADMLKQALQAVITPSYNGNKSKEDSLNNNLDELVIYIGEKTGDKTLIPTKSYSQMAVDSGKWVAGYAAYYIPEKPKKFVELVVGKPLETTFSSLEDIKINNKLIIKAAIDKFDTRKEVGAHTAKLKEQEDSSKGKDPKQLG
jgi:hypothetical protein